MERDKKGRFEKKSIPWNKGGHMWESKEHPKGMLGKESTKKGKTYEEIYSNRANEIRKKMSIKKLGIKLSEEHKKKIGEGNKGKPHSEETKKKIRNKLKGHHVSKDTKNKISKSNKGRKLSKEQCLEMSKRMKEEYRTGKRIVGMKGKRLSMKQKKRVSEILKREYKSGKRKPIRMFGKDNPFYGKIHNKKTREKISMANTGKNHPQWLGGKSFEPYDLGFNRKFKKLIRKRDNQICMVCGIHREKLDRALDVHHINYDKRVSIPQNCVTLCNPCNIKANFNRKCWVVFFQSLLSDRYGYNYSPSNEIIVEVNKQ